MVLHLAGAYQRRDGWYHRKDSEEENPADQIRRKVTEQRWMSVDEATALLVRWGMNPRYVNQWLDCQPGMSRDGEFLLTRTGSLADRAYIALRRLGEPATLPQIAGLISYKGTTAYLRNQMNQLGQFAKCTRDKYGLKEWGRPRYTSLPQAMKEAISEHGGRMPLAKLQDILMERFEIPPERTARRAACRQGLSMANGQVSLDAATGNARKTRLPMGKGLFQHSDRQMVVLALVTARILKGSRARITQTISRVMDLETEKKYYFNLPDGTTIHLSHNRRSRAAALGLLRQPLKALGAREGDIASIFLDLDKGQAKLEVTRAEDVTPSWQTVAKLTGINAAAGREGLSKAIRCQPEEIEHMLTLRKDWTVLKALPTAASRGQLQKPNSPG